MTPELDALQAQINQFLDAQLPRQSELAQTIVDAMRHTVLGGGKRLRPMLVCATADAFGAPIQQAIAPACAVEFMHAYSLIHDDLPAMDDDDLRHGLPSAHVAYGEANAILAGDALHSLAFETLANNALHRSRIKLKMMQTLAQAAGWQGMAGGQHMDIKAENQSLTLPELEALHGAKTGALITACGRLGALSACLADDIQLRARKTQCLQITRFGQRLGLAFQVMDDVLDVTQSSDTLGKPAGSDEALNKSTFPKLMGIDGARNYAHTLVDQALEILHHADLKTTLLTQLATLVIDRKH